tara:strand:+ start:312 stop:497 length:186 start_codon:yes stop_codon:yes gene_type:complete
MKFADFNRHALLADYAEACVADMDLKTMINMLEEEIIESMDDYTDEQIIKCVNDFYPELLK